MDSKEDFIFHEHKQEVLDWDAETQEKLAARKPTASYNPLSNRIRQAIPEEQLCSMFCGGRKCKYCNPPGHFDKNLMAINGLYSAWVTDNILAMSRPSSRLIEEHGIVQQFREAGIRSIINVQRPGEHASCGDGLAQPNGFSYSPQTFMDNDIFFYNFGWKDYGVASMRTILDMVRVMQFALSEGRVAVHCHAGLGRTGVILACYLVFNNRMSGIEAVHYVRAKRPGALQTQEQVDCVLKFNDFMKPLRCVFATKEAAPFNLNECLRRQSCLLHGYEGRRLKNFPKLLYVCFERLLDIGLQRTGLGSPAHRNIMSTPDLETRRRSIRVDAALAFDRDNYVNNRDSPTSDVEESGRQLASLALPDVGNELRRSASDNGLHALSDADSMDMLRRPERLGDVAATESQNSIQSAASDSLFGSGPTSGYRVRDNFGRDEASGLALEVVRSFVESHCEPETETAVAEWKERLNNEEGAWGALIREEGSAPVLAKLITDWLSHLKTPILRPQDIQLMAKHSRNPVDNLKLFERQVAGMLHYLAAFVVKLQPLPEDLDEALVLRLLSCLAHQTIQLDISPSRSLSPLASINGEWSRMRSGSTASLLRFFYSLIDALETDPNSDSVSLSSFPAAK